jgi:hypothetical protein
MLGFISGRKAACGFGAGNPPAQIVEQSVNRPWAQLADWLRVAHSLAKSGAEEQALTPGMPVIAGQEAGTASQPAKQRMRFVCTRHFVGLVIR